MNLLANWVRGEIASLEFVGLAIAFALLLALRLLLPARERALARQPAALLAASVLFLAAMRAVPPDATARRVLAFTGLLFVLGSIGRSITLLVLDVIIGRRLTHPLPKIFRDLTQGVVYATVLLISLRAAGVEPGSILTTSALLTAVIGLSLQETLGNMFAGLAIQVQRPFDVGDWIQFDNDKAHVGRVIEINWRATKVVTLDDVEVVVPNAVLNKSPITNFTKPTVASRRSVYVYAPYDAPPQTVQGVILAAIADAPGVVREPPPSVVTNSFGEFGVEYWVRFWTDQFHRRDGVDGGVRDRIWYALRRAGITQPLPQRAVRLHEVTPESQARELDAQAAARERVLRSVDFLAVMNDEERARLAGLCELRVYGKGELVVRQGDATAEMFIIERGEVSVVLERPPPHEPVELATLGPRSFFGEMALMTGEPRTASVRAVTECSLLVVGHGAFQRALATRPELLEHISHVLAERAAARDARAHEQADSEERISRVQAHRSVLLERIREFFAL